MNGLLNVWRLLLSVLLCVTFQCQSFVGKTSLISIMLLSKSSEHNLWTVCSIKLHHYCSSFELMPSDQHVFLCVINKLYMPKSKASNLMRAVGHFVVLQHVYHSICCKVNKYPGSFYKDQKCRLRNLLLRNIEPMKRINLSEK